MRETLKRFWSDESGAVTVDWVVLTAAVVALNVGLVLNMIEQGMVQAGNDIDAKIDEARNLGNLSSNGSLGGGGTGGGGTSEAGVLPPVLE